MADAQWPRLQSLFEQAIALPESERASFLANACNDDLELLSKVQALINADGATTDHGETLLERVIATDDALVGTTIGHWRLTKRIGSGGMGSIFLAERADGSFEQLVALKVIKKGMDSAAVVRRFEQERQLLAKLDHPNIARIVDSGITDDGRPCFAMEYVDGKPITEYCDSHALTIKDRLKLFMQVCEAVHTAHQNLIVHRDLKPSNILVTSASDVKLLDFGIAKLLAEEDDDTRTKTGMKMHTPVYAAPEQMVDGPTTTAVDIYALGGLLYEVLCGRRHYDVARQSRQRATADTTATKPSVGVSVLRAADSTNTHSLSDEQLERTRRIRVDRLRKTLVGDLDMICMKALHQDPDRRYSSANQLEMDIQRHLDGLPVTARPDSTYYWVSKFVQRNRVGVLATLAISTAFGLMIGHYTNELATERDNALDEQRKANEVVEFVTSLFAISDPAESKGEQISARDLLDAGAERIRTELDGQPEVQLTMQQVLGKVYFSLSALEKSRELLEDTLSRRERLLGSRHLDVAQTQLSLGLTLQALGANDRANILYEKAYATRIALLDADAPEILDAVAIRAYLQETLGNYDAAETLFRDALAMASRIAPGDTVRRAKAMKELAGLLRIRDKNDEAEPLLREALAIQNQLFGGQDPDIDDTKRQLAGLLRDSERYEEAQTLYVEVLESRTKMLGPMHLEVAHTWNSYSQLLQAKGELDAAVDANAEFIRIMEGTFDGPHPSMGAAYNNRGFLLKDQGDYASALQNFELSLATLDALDTPARHPNRSFPKVGLADTHYLQERYSQAETILREALSIRREAFGEDHRLVTEVKHNLGLALIGLEQTDEAESLLLDAYQRSVAGRGETDSKTRKTAKALADLYEQRRDLAAAQQYRLSSEVQPDTN